MPWCPSISEGRLDSGRHCRVGLDLVPTHGYDAPAAGPGEHELAVIVRESYGNVTCDGSPEFRGANGYLGLGILLAGVCFEGLLTQA